MGAWGRDSRCERLCCKFHCNHTGIRQKQHKLQRPLVCGRIMESVGCRLLPWDWPGAVVLTSWRSVAWSASSLSSLRLTCAGVKHTCTSTHWGMGGTSSFMQLLMMHCLAFLS